MLIDMAWGYMVKFPIRGIMVLVWRVLLTKDTRGCNYHGVSRVYGNAPYRGVHYSFP
jgi:hypothetical protein